MKLLDFRSWMIEQIRAFDNWAWKDMRENPGDWAAEMSEEDWVQMFKDFIGDND